MKQPIELGTGITEEQIAAMVNDIATLNQRYDAYQAELQSLEKSIVNKTLELSKYVTEPIIVVHGTKAIPVTVEKTSKRVIVQDPVYCVNL